MCARTCVCTRYLVFFCSEGQCYKISRQARYILPQSQTPITSFVKSPYLMLIFLNIAHQLCLWTWMVSSMSVSWECTVFLIIIIAGSTNSNILDLKWYIWRKYFKDEKKLTCNKMVRVKRIVRLVLSHQSTELCNSFSEHIKICQIIYKINSVF